MTTSPRARRREALRAARSTVPGPISPTSPRTTASAPQRPVPAHPRAVNVPPERPASPPAPASTSSAPSWNDVDRLADELAQLGDDLPAGLTVDERRAAILERLRE